MANTRWKALDEIYKFHVLLVTVFTRKPIARKLTFTRNTDLRVFRLPCSARRIRPAALSSGRAFATAGWRNRDRPGLFLGGP